jgi:hypothetical protein
MHFEPGRASSDVIAVLLRVLRAGGRDSAGVVVSRLREGFDRSAVSDLLHVASTHPSAHIRDVARQAGAI